jgi:tetratricopeptide (TPR) repeat protein
MKKPLLALVVVVVSSGLSASAHVDPELHARQVGERLEHDAEHAERLHLRRGVLHAKSKRWTEAIRDFDQALHHDPTLHEARLRKAGALLDGGCHDQAAIEAEAFLEHNPDDPQALITWARAVDQLDEPGLGRRHAGKRHEALFAFDSALAQFEHPAPSVFVERARMVLRADETAFDRAIVGLEKGMRRVGPVSTLLLEAVAIERRAGRPHRALERLEVLLDGSGAHPRWLLLEGELLEEIGRHRQARAAYQRSLEWVAKLPASRRSTDAMRRLHASASQRLQRLPRLSQTSQTREP